VPPLPVGTDKRGSSPAKFLIPVGAVVVIVASIFVWQHVFISNVVVKAEARPASSLVVAATAAPVTPAAPKPTPVAAPAPLPQVAPAPKPAPVAVIPSPLDTIKLEGVLLDDADSTAILNGKTYSIGERINGVMVEAINSTGVTLGYNGHRKVLRVR
jgi:hypothetical protein